MKNQAISVLSALGRLRSRHTLVVVAVALFSIAVLTVFTNIPDSAASEERATIASAQSFSQIINNPVNAPYKIGVYIATSISPSVRAARAISFIFYVAACIAMFYALKHWHTLQTSLLTTAAFATNSIVLGVSRLGTPLITAMSLFIFSGLLLWQLHSKSNKFVPYIVLVALGCLIYTPGVLWFMVIIGAVYWNRFKKLFINVKKQIVMLGAITTLLIVTPLILSFISSPSVLKEWLLLPETFVWSEVAQSILQVPSAFIYRMPGAPLINTARLPVFDVASGLLFLIGLNAYRRKLKLDRTRIMLGSVLMGTIVGALGQTVIAVILIAPFAYSVIAAGIEFMLDEWHGVFPKNPFACSFGVVFISTVVLFSMYYQITRFFVVWPQAADTRATYNQSRIIQDQ